MPRLRVADLLLLASLLLFGSTALATAESATIAPAGYPRSNEAARFPQLETEGAQVWRTVIIPKHPADFHWHNKRRIVVPLTDTRLRIKYQDGTSHVLDWKKGKAYLLKADEPGKLHMDVNESDHPMEVMVIQLN